MFKNVLQQSKSKNYAIQANLNDIKERNERLMKHNKNANTLKRKEMKKNLRLLKRIEPLKSGSSDWKPRSRYLRQVARERIGNSQTGTIAAEIHVEALEHEIERFQDNLKVIKEMIEKKGGKALT